MSEIIVAYWSGTGNTAAMADYVGQGIEESGKKARVVSISDITYPLKNYLCVVRYPYNKFTLI